MIHPRPASSARALLLVAAALLAAPAAAQDRNLGLVVQNNVNAMLVDPNPVYAGIPIEGSNGVKADTAITRYRSGRVAPLQSFSGNTNIGNAGAGASSTSAQPTGNGPR